MAGMRVIGNPAIGTSELFAMESGLAEVYFKRNPIIKIGQEDDDLSKDQYTMVMFLRAQVLVEKQERAHLCRRHRRRPGFDHQNSFSRSVSYGKDTL